MLVVERWKGNDNARRKFAQILLMHENIEKVIWQTFRQEDARLWGSHKHDFLC